MKSVRPVFWVLTKAHGADFLESQSRTQRSLNNIEQSNHPGIAPFQPGSPVVQNMFNVVLQNHQNRLMLQGFWESLASRVQSYCCWILLQRMFERARLAWTTLTRPGTVQSKKRDEQNLIHSTSICILIVLHHSICVIIVITIVIIYYYYYYSYCYILLLFVLLLYYIYLFKKQTIVIIYYTPFLSLSCLFPTFIQYSFPEASLVPLQGSMVSYQHHAIGTALLHPGDRWHAVQPLRAGSRWMLLPNDGDGSPAKGDGDSKEKWWYNIYIYIIYYNIYILYNDDLWCMTIRKT